MRELYPDLIYGAYASSAPVLFKEDFFEYAIAVDEGIPRIDGGSRGCRDGLKTVIGMIDEILTSGDRDAILLLKQEVGLSSVIDDRDFAAWISEIPAGSIQYGPSTQWLWESQYVTIIEGLCSDFPWISDPEMRDIDKLSHYKQFVAAIVEGMNEEEIEKINTNYYAVKLDSPGRLWWWQVCTEFGYWQVAEPIEMGKSVYTRLNDVAFNRENCAKIFGQEHAIPHIKEVSQFYGNGNFHQDRILWVNGIVLLLIFTAGAIDPWRYLGFTDTANSTDAQPVLFHDAFHCSDLYNGSIKGTSTVVAKIYTAFSRWL